MAGYGTDQGLEEWLALRGLVLPGDALPAALRQLGSDYLDAAYGARLTCSRPAGGFDQERAWPRTGHVAGGATVPPDVVPDAWIRASYRAAWLIANDPEFGQVTIVGGNRAKRERVDTLEVEYFVPGETGLAAGALATVDAEIEGMVAGLLCPDGKTQSWLMTVGT